MKPMCYLRLLNGKPDWAEDCVSEDQASLEGTIYPEAEGYSVLPLYAIPKGWTLVPNSPTDGMLRPFIECPEDELRLAWDAALMVCQHTVPVVDMGGDVRAVPA